MWELFSELVGPMIIAFAVGSALAVVVATILLRPVPEPGSEPTGPRTPTDQRGA